MVTQIVLGIAVLGLLIYRQLVARRIGGNGLRLMLILGAIGLFETVQYLSHHHGGAFTFAALAGSLVLAAIFGVARAYTTKVWVKDGVAWSKGNWITAVLWVAALGAHLGYDALIGTHHGVADLGTATIVLYLAVSLGLQRLIVEQRARRLSPGPGPSPSYGSGPVGGFGSR